MKNPETTFQDFASRFEDFLQREVITWIERETVPEVSKPTVYSLSAGGKRLRPVLCLLAAGVKPESADHAAWWIASAIECIHTYSLIHDDLPAMDNDDLRRGKPSCHKQFSDWAAILAGDALNTFAFELLVRPGHPQTPRMVRTLASGAGMAGMVGGQALDLEAEKNPGRARTEEALRAIHTRKTGAMFRASLELGALAAGHQETEAFGAYGSKLGELFQVSDDLIDETSTSETLGKTAGKDRASGKLTYPVLLGIDETRRLCERLAHEAVDLAGSLTQGPEAPIDYREVFEWIPAMVSSRLK